MAALVTFSNMIHLNLNNGTKSINFEFRNEFMTLVKFCAGLIKIIL